MSIQLCVFNDATYGLGLVLAIQDNTSKTRHVEVIFEKNPKSSVRDNKVWYCTSLTRLFRDNIYAVGFPEEVHVSCDCFKKQDELQRLERGLPAIESRGDKGRVNGRKKEIEKVRGQVDNIKVHNRANLPQKENPYIIFVGSDEDAHLKTISTLMEHNTTGIHNPKTGKLEGGYRLLRAEELKA